MAIGETSGITPVMSVNPTSNNGYNAWGGEGMWFMWIIVLFFLIGGNGFGYSNNGTTQQMAADLSAAKTQAAVWQSNDQQNLMSAIGQVRDGNVALGNGIADATFALNNAVTNGFSNMQRDVLQNGFNIQQAIGNANSTLMGASNNLAREIVNVGNSNLIQGIQNTNALNQGITANGFMAQQGFSGINQNIDNVRYDNAMNTCKVTTNSTENTQRILDKLAAMESNAKDAEIANLRSQLASAQMQVSQYDQNATLVAAIRPFPQPAYVVSSPYGTTTTTCPYANA